MGMGPGLFPKLVRGHATQATRREFLGIHGHGIPPLETVVSRLLEMRHEFALAASEVEDSFYTAAVVKRLKSRCG